MAATEQGQRTTGTDLAERHGNKPIPLYNGVISPDKWTTFGRMAYAFAKTEFVPKDLRGRPDAVLACLVYGDSLGIHPSVALKEVFVADGKPGISGALMLAMIRRAGHKIRWEEIVTSDLEKSEFGDGFIGWRVYGQRVNEETGEVEEEDSWSYSMEDAKTAGLYPNASNRAAWMKTPKVMCRWRALAQLARFLFPDVFAGQAIYLPEEAEEIADAQRRVVNGSVSQGGGEVEEADYGSDPLLAGWLVALFAAANEIEEGLWLPKKVQMTLKGKTQDERETLASDLAQWIEERGGVVPTRPVEEEVEDADFEVIDTSAEGQPADDPGAHLNGDSTHEAVTLDE